LVRGLIPSTSQKNSIVLKGGIPGSATLCRVLSSFSSLGGFPLLSAVGGRNRGVWGGALLSKRQGVVTGDADSSKMQRSKRERKTKIIPPMETESHGGGNCLGGDLREGEVYAITWKKSRGSLPRKGGKFALVKKTLGGGLQRENQVEGKPRGWSENQGRRLFVVGHSRIVTEKRRTTFGFQLGGFEGEANSFLGPRH